MPCCQHCYVTGGTSGLGLAVAQRLVRLGAHVSIVARNKDNLATALESLEVSAFPFLTQADFSNSNRYARQTVSTMVKY